MVECMCVGEEYEIYHKRKAPHPQVKVDDIYVKGSKHMGRYFNRAKSLFNDKNFKSVTVHGLGKAVVKAIELALRIEQEILGHLKVALRVETESVKLIDDHIPQDLNLAPEEKERWNSAVHICITVLE